MTAQAEKVVSLLGVPPLLNFYHNYNVKLGNDWFINDKNTIGFILYMPGEYTTMNSKGSTTEQFRPAGHLRKKKASGCIQLRKCGWF